MSPIPKIENVLYGDPGVDTRKNHRFGKLPGNGIPDLGRVIALRDRPRPEALVAVFQSPQHLVRRERRLLLLGQHTLDAENVALGVRRTCRHENNHPDPMTYHSWFS